MIFSYLYKNLNFCVCPSVEENCLMLLSSGLLASFVYRWFQPYSSGVREPRLIFYPGKSISKKNRWAILYLYFYPGKKLTQVPIPHYWVMYSIFSAQNHLVSNFDTAMLTKLKICVHFFRGPWKCTWWALSNMIHKENNLTATFAVAKFEVFCC